MTIEKDVKVTESCLSNVWDPLTKQDSLSLWYFGACWSI